VTLGFQLNDFVVNPLPEHVKVLDTTVGPCVIDEKYSVK
jgi:hypothetical protein